MKKSIYTAIPLFAFLSVLPAVAGAAEVQRYQFRGENVSASFYDVDDTGCIQTNVWLWGGESVTREGPGRPAERSELYVTVSKVDVCNWSYLYEGSGSATAANLEIDRTNAATLKATVPIYDSVSGTTSDVTLDLARTGTCDVFRGHNSSHY